MARLVGIPWARFSLGAEKMIENGDHLHIGELGTVGSDENETSEEEILETSYRLGLIYLTRAIAGTGKRGAAKACRSLPLYRACSAPTDPWQLLAAE
jgi:hypothetical protein